MANPKSQGNGQKKKQAKQRSAPAPKNNVISAASASGGFGLGDTRAMAMYSNTGSVTTKHELGLQIVDFFGYQSAAPSGVAQYVHHYYWDVGQNLFQNGAPLAGEAQTYCRPRKLHVYVLPQARGIGARFDSIRTNDQQTFTVNVQVPGISTSLDASAAPLEPKAYALNTQVTNVLPQFDAKWKKVMTCDYNKTFKSGIARPVFGRPAAGAVGNRTDQLMFSMSIVSPSFGEPYQTGNFDAPDPDILVKVVLEVDQPIQIVSQASLGVYRNEEFTLPSTGQSEGDFQGTRESYVQLDLKRRQDFLR